MKRFKERQLALARACIGAVKKEYEGSNMYLQKIQRHLLDMYGDLPRPDHFAIRTVSGVGFGRSEAGRLLSYLGYTHGGCYWIEKLGIASCHWDPPGLDPTLEKVFVSEILIDDFWNQKETAPRYAALCKVLRDCIPYLVAENVSSSLNCLCDTMGRALWCGSASSIQDAEFEFLKFFTQVPWGSPLTVFSKNFRWLKKYPFFSEIAHVLAYGWVPNHFTYLLSDPSYQYPSYTTMQEFAEELRGLNIPMKPEVEGEEDSVFCQTSTLACPGVFFARDRNDAICTIGHPYTYVEFAKRGKDNTSPTGRFEKFIVEQAEALFKSA